MSKLAVFTILVEDEHAPQVEKDLEEYCQVHGHHFITTQESVKGQNIKPSWNKKPQQKPTLM